MAAPTTWNDRATRVLQRVAVPAFWASLACKVVLAVLGAAVIVVPGELGQVTLLFAWCLLGSAYIAGVGAGLVVASRFAAADGQPKLMEISAGPRIASIVGALVAVTVGVWAAVQHTLIDATSPTGWSANLLGIWAMILAWLLLHWGFAQIYLQQYYRFTPRTLEFPHDGAPGVLEFSYFAYGIAVSLAVSDVVVTASRARLVVLGHSVLSFFFNGLIIVTALAALAEVAGVR